MNNLEFQNLIEEKTEREQEKKALNFLEKFVNELNRKRIFTDKILRKIDDSF